MDTKPYWMNQGWECPKCGAVMSPTTSCCVNCRENKGGGMSTTITNPAEIKPVYTVEERWTGYLPINDPSSICGTSSQPYVSSKGSHDDWWEKAQLNGYKSESHPSPVPDSFKYKTEE